MTMPLRQLADDLEKDVIPGLMACEGWRLKDVIATKRAATILTLLSKTVPPSEQVNLILHLHEI